MMLVSVNTDCRDISWHSLIFVSDKRCPSSEGNFSKVQELSYVSAIIGKASAATRTTVRS